MTVVEPIWINGKRERRLFFAKELNDYLNAIKITPNTLDTFDEIGIDLPQIFPDFINSEVKKIKVKRFNDAVARMNLRGDEWDKLYPNDKSKRIPIKSYNVCTK